MNSRVQYQKGRSSIQESAPKEKKNKKGTLVRFLSPKKLLFSLTISKFRSSLKKNKERER